ncbi:protein of unassigned function [Methylobacterium oryzae CBMB20]|uniref:Protein of unassigned function n=1 Tax=Methylobacterium oryzae CBMB20 TaxID=693986 RepID=A0A089P212_9HYPH|nr:protein of unassigned function [Methylobacterium oryzae CBMB20]
MQVTDPFRGRSRPFGSKSPFGDRLSFKTVLTHPRFLLWNHVHRRRKLRMDSRSA